MRKTRLQVAVAVQLHSQVNRAGLLCIPSSQQILDSPEKLEYMKERIPLGRLAEPEDIVGPIVFFSSRAADYCTGTQLVVDGGGTARAMAR